MVEPDAAAQRVFYLVQNNGWQIKAYHMQSRLLLGKHSITFVTGTPSSLIRWGTNGLAFRSSSNQLVVIRSPLIAADAAADIALTLAGPGAPVAIGSNAAFTLTITNQGPGQATSLQIANSFSSLVNLTSVSASGGTLTTNFGTLIWTLSSLNAGAQASLSDTIMPRRWTGYGHSRCHCYLTGFAAGQ